MAARTAKIGTRAAPGFFARFVNRAALVAALFVVQTLLGGQIQIRLPAASVEAKIAAHNCDSRNDGDAPAPDHRKATHCCMLCSSSAMRDGSPEQIIASSPEIYNPPQIRANGSSFRALDAEPSGSAGCKGSWSSRAPPLFS
jgi:hypothetical protein